MKTKSAILIILIGLGFCLSNCNRKLPEEERKAVKEELDRRTIVRITPAEIFSFTENEVKDLNLKIESGEIPESTALYTIEKVNPENVEGEKVQQIMEAYIFSLEQGEDLRENRQELDNGDILYSIPVVEDSAGIKKLIHLVNIRFIKSEVIRKLSEEAQ